MASVTPGAIALVEPYPTPEISSPSNSDKIISGTPVVIKGLDNRFSSHFSAQVSGLTDFSTSTEYRSDRGGFEYYDGTSWIVVPSSGVPRNSYASTVLGMSGLVAYYKMDETSGTTLVDSGPNGLNGSYVLTPTLGQPGALVNNPSTSVLMNGTSQYASIANNSVFNITGDFSCAFWFRPANALTQRIVGLINKRTTDSVTPWSIQMLPDWSFDFSYWTGSLWNGWGNVGQTWSQGSQPYFNQGQWNFAVVVRNCTQNYIAAYMNNVKSVPNLTALTGVTNTQGVWIGRYAGNSFYASGYFDEMTVWNRALTDAEISNLYQIGKAIHPPVRLKPSLSAGSTYVRVRQSK